MDEVERGGKWDAKDRGMGMIYDMVTKTRTLGEKSENLLSKLAERGELLIQGWQMGLKPRRRQGP